MTEQLRIVIISPDGSIHLTPHDLEALHLTPGDEFILNREGDVLTLTPLTLAPAQK